SSPAYYKYVVQANQSFVYFAISAKTYPENASAALADILGHQATIKAALGPELCSGKYGDDERIGFRIADGGYKHRANWLGLQDELFHQMTRLKATLDPVLRDTGWTWKEDES